MTTIAYRNGIIAGDTQISGGNANRGHANKIGRRGRLLYGASGSSPWMRRFLEWVKNGCQYDPPAGHKDEEGEGIVILPDGRILTAWADGAYSALTAEYYAIGSGGQFAIGAMAAGAKATHAVGFAAKHDVYTGHDIIWFGPTMSGKNRY